MAYSSDRSGGWAIFVTPLYGVGERQLTPSGSVAANPSWSPDSSRIAYWSLEGNVSSIRVVTVSNDSIVTVSDKGDGAINMTPVWSPDGSHLLYFVEATSPRLVSVDVRTLQTKVVAEVNDSSLNPSWAGNDRVVYSDLVGGLYAIKWINLTSGEAGILREGGNNYWGGIVSPDGAVVAYYSNQTELHAGQPPDARNDVWVNFLNETRADVWTSQLDDSQALYLFQRGLHTFSPRVHPGDVIPTEQLHWSFDSSLVACVLDYSLLGRGVYVWDFGNSTVNRVGPENGQSTQPTWSPTQLYLAFSCNSTGSWQIWIASYMFSSTPGNPLW
jgi:Tol biopolymer transport system component